jgi:hypothetical protein
VIILFFLFGWGKVTKKVVGPMFEKSCGYCNQTQTWQLCKNRTWFTLFFIPVLPYNTRYSISCPNCGSYIAITDEQFNTMKADLAAAGNMSHADAIDSIKYAGKNAVQINYLKQMEELNNKK